MSKIYCVAFQFSWNKEDGPEITRTISYPIFIKLVTEFVVKISSIEVGLTVPLMFSNDLNTVRLHRTLPLCISSSKYVFSSHSSLLLSMLS